MNLLVYAPQMAAYGGMERHVCLVAEAAAQSGARVTLLTTSNALGDIWRARLAQAGIALRELAVARGRARRVHKAVWLGLQALRLRRHGWDVVYTNGQGALAWIVWRAGGDRTRRIHHHHTAADAAEQTTWSRAYRAVLARAPELVGCSRFTTARLNEAAGRSDARFLPYFTESAFAAHPPPAVPLTADRPLRFGFFGRLVPTKGIETILRLAADPAGANLEWHIHGAGPDYPPGRFAGRSNLFYHGSYATIDEQAAALTALDAVALFSLHNEGMPLSLIEAMAAGLPWVASARGGTPELAASTAECELVAQPEDFACCRDAVLRLAGRIRSGATTRARQRAVWTRQFAPPVVRRLWLEFLGCSA